MVLVKIPKFYMELLSVLSCAVVSDSVIPWTVAHQAPLSMVFSRQEYWSGLPFFSSRGSSQLRDQTLVSYIVNQILYHWATWEANGAPENSFMAREKLPGCHMATLIAPSMKYKSTNHCCQKTSHGSWALHKIHIQKAGFTQPPFSQLLSIIPQ